jgi:nucleoside-diphosphate-sugar epimerase
MKVVVTGGSGFTGRHVVEHLVNHGHEVVNADRIPPQKALCPYRLVDMEDLGQVVGCFNGAEAIVHLAAIPRPVFHTNDVVFRTNVMAAYNVLEAAATLGIRRLVYASSVSVLGYPFYYRYFAPQYVPIDEDHPSQPQDPYALSKYLGEEIAKAFVRRADMTVISLRLVWIHTPESFKEQLSPMWNDPAAGASNLWSYIDGRDVAEACRLSLQADLCGHHAFFIAAPNTFMKTPTAELVKQFYSATEIRSGLVGNQALVSSAKAEKVLGFHALYTWEMYYQVIG